VTAALRAGATNITAVQQHCGLPSSVIRYSLTKLVRARRVVATGNTHSRRFTLAGSPPAKEED
jgi:hypothetical protein